MAQIDKPNLHFNTKLYTGNGSTNAITGVGFQPDWLWIKDRGSTYYHYIQDAVRSSDNVIFSNGNDAAQDYANAIQSFDTDGFTTGSQGATNNNSNNFVSWNWKGNGAGSSNSDGDITSTVSANTTAGFSVVKFTANGSNNDGIGHGLGVAPKIIFYKRLDSTGDWFVVYKFVDGSLDFLKLNNTDAKTDITLGTYGFSTSTTFTNLGFGNTQEYIAYCFAEKKGYSKIGSYVGNGNNDGAFVYTGFKPAWVIIKKTTGDGWQMFDNKRDPHNVAYHRIEADSTAGDYTGLSAGWIDMVSNGFKVRYSGGGVGTSGVSYIYMAFAENPIVGSNNIPATAR